MVLLECSGGACPEFRVWGFTMSFGSPNAPTSEDPARPTFDPAALDALLGTRRTLDAADALFRQMKAALRGRVLRGELTHHQGYGPGEARGRSPRT